MRRVALVLCTSSVHCVTLGSGLPPAVPSKILGPPAHFDGMQVGTQYLSMSRECSVSGASIQCEVVRLASRPACFHVGGLLSDAECDAIVASAHALGMEPATTAGGDNRCGCGVAWVPVASNEVASSVSAACEQLFLQPEVLEPSTDWASAGRWENMQVLKYAEGGEFKLHYDSNEQVHRVCTVLIYLNGVGSTWFPLALRDPKDAQSVGGANPPRQAALAAAERLSPSREDGLVVTPRKGDAVAFYNYMNDGSAQVDRLALHAGLPAPAEKSIASLWVRPHPALRLSCA